MNFCNNCAADLRILVGARFCYNCGNKLATSTFPSNARFVSEQRNSERVNPRLNKNKEFDNGYNSYGIIFTHISSLANCLKCDEEDVTNVICDYISNIAKFGHQYLLIDASNNPYQSLYSDDHWTKFVDLLKIAVDNFSIKPDNLFIIGGHDVIPMAIIENEPRCYETDLDIETDMPYSYLLTDNFENDLWYGRIFSKKIEMFVGRYPVASDSEINNLEHYLSRSLKTIKSGLAISSCYGMSAYSWASASQAIINEIRITKKLHTSPEIDINSVDEVFNQYAQLYYFNLHGSDAPGSPEFFGDRNPAISPEHLATAEDDNFLMTEACYGAKFIGYNENESMLLKSINNKTVAYVGSSKVAFGSSTEMISCADVVAKVYIENICLGESCGRALAEARVEVFNSCLDDHFDYGTTSAAEFNLFGDPIISIYGNSKSSKIPNRLFNKKIHSKVFSKTRPVKKEIKLNTQQKGILNDVRNLVNQEILKINEIVNKNLYLQFSIEPRQPTNVFEINGKFGEKTYNYIYSQDFNAGLKKCFSVFTDKTGKIKSVLESK